MTYHVKHSAGTPLGPGQHGAREERAVFLEPDQLTAGQQSPVPRAALSPRARAALWALRIFVIAVSAMVIYTFAAQLRR